MRKLRLFFITLMLFFGVVCILIYFSPLKHRIMIFLSGQQSFKNCPGCNIYFPDVVAVQEKAYRNERIKKQQTFKGLDRLHAKGDLSEIASNEYYLVEDMGFARPYVMPKVVDFLNELSLQYKEELDKKGVSYYPFSITSATRSIESANDLADENTIARKNSHHLLGKTLDISYKKFGGSKERQLAFIDALKSLRESGKCYVIYEIKGALHLTVR
jgi:uncharacterized protein YcbK (DUF882 family)